MNRLDHPVLTEHQDDLIIEGVANSEPFQKTIIEMTQPDLDLDRIENDVVEAARRLNANSDVGALVFECTNLRPYVDAVQRETKLPVFDFLTLSNMVYSAACGTRY
jgi:hypothetical protein